MKILIWLGCMIVSYLIQIIVVSIVSLIPSSDITAIAVLPLLRGALSATAIGLCVWAAIKLCKALDWYRVMKKASEAGMTVSEYGRHGLSEEFLAKLEELFNTVPLEQAKPQLKACVKKGKITKEQYIILLNEYSTTK